MRIVFKDGQILDLENVDRVICQMPEDTSWYSGLRTFMREEYSRGYKDGYKTGIIDYKTKHAGVPDMMGEQE